MKHLQFELQGRSARSVMGSGCIRVLAVTTPTISCAQLLKRIAADPGGAVMSKYKYSVGCLSELPPEGRVGVSSVCLMGLNKNSGEEILSKFAPMMKRDSESQGGRSPSPRVST